MALPKDIEILIDKEAKDLTLEEALQLDKWLEEQEGNQDPDIVKLAKGLKHAQIHWALYDLQKK